MRKKDKGQGMVEFALLLPIMAVVILGVVVLFHLFAVLVTTHNAASEGGREAAVWRTNGVDSCLQVVTEAVTRMTPFFDPATGTIATSANCGSDPWARIPSGTNITVSVIVQWEPIFFGTLGQDYWEPPRNLSLSAAVTVRHE